MLLIYPPLAKPCEPPAGLARLAGVLRGHGQHCTLLDANIEGLLDLLSHPCPATDTWTSRASRNLENNLINLRSSYLYRSLDRYSRAVADVNHLIDVLGRPHGLAPSLANYQDQALSPLQSRDLLQAAAEPEKNIFFPYFSKRVPQLLEEQAPALLGISLNYLSQALTTFAMIGFLKKNFPALPIIIGGGLITSWLQQPEWDNPFGDLIDQMVSGPGEAPLLQRLQLKRQTSSVQLTPCYKGLPLADYLSPGLILPYAASSGCYWNRCSFCPEKAEENPYHPVPVDRVREHLGQLIDHHKPSLLHFLDNAISPALLRSLAEKPPEVNWYGFARVHQALTDADFCLALRHSGCLMLKLGIESGDQGVLDAMDKGIDLSMVSKTLHSLKNAGIATYIYLLFGTPTESRQEAQHTMDFVIEHSETITYLNLAIFNMPVCGAEAHSMGVQKFYAADLSLYTDFPHPRGWGRKEVRTFLDQEFKRHPAIQPILRRDPPLFTSNHAPFFQNLCMPSHTP